MRQQPRAGDSARNRAFRRLSLNQCRTAGAGQFGAHMADHTEAGRYKLQHLSDVFADAAQVATALGQPASSLIPCRWISRGRCAGKGLREGVAVRSLLRGEPQWCAVRFLILIPARAR